MILKLNEEEFVALRRYEDGPFGEDSFESFMAEMNGRIDEDTRQIDIGRDERERIEDYRCGHEAELDGIFMRPLAEAFDEFFG